MALPIFITWREEIQADLARARDDLVVANGELEAARATADDAKAERTALNAAIERIGKRMQVPGALLIRHRHRDAELVATDGPVTKAKQARAVALTKIADCEVALFLLDELDPPQPEPAEVLEPELENA